MTEATTPESRHAWVIEVAPATDAGATAPTEAQKAAAKAKADAALADLKAGKAWDDVAKVVSTDTSTAPQAGDLGWIQKDDTGTDEAFVDAVFAATANTPTDVVEGADGIYRIGRASEIVAESVDAAYQAKIQNAGIELAKYRAVVAGDVIHQKLEDKIVADASKAGPQRHVSEIYIAETSPTPTTDAVKVRHIQFSPKDDPPAPPPLPPPTRPGRRRRPRPTRRTRSSRPIRPCSTRWPGPRATRPARRAIPAPAASSATSRGSDLSQAEDFKAAILAPGLQPGQLLAPVKTASAGTSSRSCTTRRTPRGWPSSRPTADAGADFAALARDNSESETASKGGDLGWVAPASSTRA